jgi:GT2 family glycosyltransferase
MRQFELGIVVVDYHSPLQTVSFVKHQLSLCTVPHKIVIVLNDVKANELEIVTKALACQVLESDDDEVDLSQQVYVLSNVQNLGYGKGNNVGARFLDKHFQVEFLSFCNNDLNFERKDPYYALVKKMETSDDIGAIGPKILGLDGKDQNPYRYISLLDKYLYRNLLNPVFNLVSKRFYYGALLKDAPEGYYYRLMGCFLLVRADAFKACGMFDDNTFLFGEEAILSERLSNIKKHCYYYPQVSIIHEHGKTISQYFKQKKRLMEEYKTDSYYYINYRSNAAYKVKLVLPLLKLFIILSFWKERIKLKSK